MEKIKYIGCFFDRELILEKAEEQQPERLYQSIRHPHVTFRYRPDSVPYEAFGQAVTVKVVGYGRDEENEAFAVEIQPLEGVLEKLSRKIKVPHITLSVSQNGEAVNSCDLRFDPIEPFFLQGVFGGMGEGGTLYTHWR